MANDKRGSWLKSILVKEDEEVAQKEKQTVGTYQAKFNPVNPINIPITPIVNIDTETPDQVYLDHLYKFMEDQNIPGPDYFEFANTLHEMSRMAGTIPEQSLFQLAYVSLKTQGITPEVLVQTAQKYVSMFEKHKQEFENVLSQEIQKSVSVKTQECQSLEQANKQAEVKMAELQQQIQSLQQQMIVNAQKIADNNAFIQNEGQKLSIKKTKFEKAYSIVVDKVNGDIQKIQNYIK